MKSEMELQVGHLHARMVTETDPVGFFTMENTDALGVNEREIWLHSDQEDLLGVNDASVLYADFPPLPDFPCMSSSSSSSSTPAPAKTITCSSSSSSSVSSSSAVSWAVLKSDVEEDVEKRNSHYYIKQHDPVDAPPPVLSSTASMEISQPTDQNPHGVGVGVGDCMDVLQTFRYMDLLENDYFFDPISIFQNDENPLEEFTQEQKPQQEEHRHVPVVVQQPPPTPQQEPEEGELVVCTNTSTNNEDEMKGKGGPDGEMSTVFFEWLKSNKDSVSANDLRSVKLKKATIECASRRLGGGKEAMKQLLKLILEWVQTSHLQNKKRKQNAPSNFVTEFQDPSQNQNTNPSSNLNHRSSFGPASNNCFIQSPWTPPPPYGADPGELVAAPPLFPQPMIGYVGDPYTNVTSNNINGTHNTAYLAATEYQMLESAHSWPHSQFTVASHYNQSFRDHNLHPAGPSAAAVAFAGYGNQYPYKFYHGPGDRLTRLGPLATKEARKKRMARQRRYLSHHRHHNHHAQQQNQHHQNQTADLRMGSHNYTAVVAAAHANPANWVYWQAMVGGALRWCQ